MPKAPPQTPTNKEPKRIPNTGHDNDFCGWVEGVFPEGTPPISGNSRVGPVARQAGQLSPVFFEIGGELSGNR